MCLPVAARVNSAEVSAPPARGRLALGSAHSCAIASNDVVWCWGDNSFGQLGSSVHASLPAGQSDIPVQVAALPGGRVARQITSGDFHACVLANDGTVWCWGYNGFGELGVSGGNQADPVQVTLPANAILVAAGGNTTCAVLSTNSVMCWGRHHRGQLGNGNQTNTVGNATPTVVVSIPSSFTVVSLDVGTVHACATSTTGDTWCWGAFTNGRLGNSSVSDNLTPSRVAAFGGGTATSAAAGFAHSCVVVGTRAWCFGSNSSGQLGTNPSGTTESSTPLSVTFSSSANVVATGRDFTCALLASQTVECFGINAVGQLGNGNSTPTHVPQVVSGLSSGVVDVALGARHACVALTTGAVRCWGEGTAGQLGNGSTSTQTASVSVGSLNIAPTTTTLATTTTIATTTTTANSPVTSSPTTTNPTSTGQQSITSTPRFLTVKRGRTLTARAIASHVSLKIPKTSQGSLRLTIVRGARSCMFVGTKVRGTRKGTCSVLVTLIPKRGPRILRTAKVVVS